MSEKCQKFEKIQVRSDDDIFKKFRQNAQILKSLVSVSNFKSCVLVSVSEFLKKSRSSSRLEILTRSRSRRLRSRLLHWYTVPSMAKTPRVVLQFKLYRLLST